jgi:hypothetical protein
MAGVPHSPVDTNGIRMHPAEPREALLVILCHGVPRCCYAWRPPLSRGRGRCRGGITAMA